MYVFLKQPRSILIQYFRSCVRVCVGGCVFGNERLKKKERDEIILRNTCIYIYIYDIE